MTLNNETILDRINTFIDKEGFKVEHIANLMNKKSTTIYNRLKDSQSKSVSQFAIDFAEVMGRKRTFFIEEDFQYMPTVERDKEVIAFSSGKELSEEGKEALGKLNVVCEIIKNYSR
ncbi:hypothetical protein ABC345_21390 [Shouchella sp. 1P09AA]|uniref:hypothetical protein n=1 Tax=unclassified Shouchella TaxID=2893065 RepID=UPI00399F0278